MASGSSREHHERAGKRGAVCIAVVTVSDTRTPKTDANADFLEGEIKQSGNILHSIRIVADEPELVQSALGDLVAEDEVQVILFNGGTGISRRDRTYDVLSKEIDKELPGFGELFRMLSYEQVGAAAILSRAMAGVCRGKVIISVPGSPAAVRLAWQKLIHPELAHLAWEVVR